MNLKNNNQKSNHVWSVVVHAYYPNLWEVEAEKLGLNFSYMSSRPT